MLKKKLKLKNQVNKGEIIPKSVIQKKKNSIIYKSMLYSKANCRKPQTSLLQQHYTKSFNQIYESNAVFHPP